MKRIGILSDTHSHRDPRYALYLSGCDEIWHAGDIGDIDLLAELRAIGPTLRAVRGNIDHGLVARECPELLAWDCEGLRCVMTHIGGYPGRYRRGIPELLRHEKAGLFISGHSHILRVMYDQRLNCLHINPGAAGVHGWQTVRTLVRLTIDHATPRDLEVIHLSQQK